MLKMSQPQVVAAEVIVPGSNKIRCVCELCNISFGLRGNLNRHLRKFHQLQIEFQAKQECPLCSEKIFSMNALHQHIQIEHSIALEFMEKTFYSDKDFQDWKKKLEDETHSMFIIRNSSESKLSGIITTYYKCNRSGTYKFKENRNRKVKAKGSIKVGKTCPAFMRVTTQTVDEISEIKVQIQTVHLGHELETRTLTLRKEERENLSACLRLGIPMDKILDEAKQNYSPTNRYNLLTRKHLHNLRRTLGIQPDDNKSQNVSASQNFDAESSCSSVGLNDYFEVEVAHHEEVHEHEENTAVERDHEEVQEHERNTPLESYQEEVTEHEQNTAVSSLLSLQLQQNHDSEEFSSRKISDKFSNRKISGELSKRKISEEFSNKKISKELGKTKTSEEFVNRKIPEEVSNRKIQIINQLKELQSRIEEWNPFSPLPEVEEHIKAINARLDISAGSSIPVIHLPESQPIFEQASPPNKNKTRAKATVKLRRITKNGSKKKPQIFILD